MRKHSKKISLLLALVMVFALAMTVCAAFAEEPTPQETISTAVTSAMQTTQNDALGLIASVIPYALAIVGAILVVSIGIRVFKKISGR